MRDMFRRSLLDRGKKTFSKSNLGGLVGTADKGKVFSGVVTK